MLMLNKFDLCDVYNGGGDSNDDVGVDDIGRVNTNGGDAADFGNGDGKLDCDADRGGGDGGDKDDGGVDDDGDADSDIGDDANCRDDRSKVDCSKNIAVDDGNSISDGGGDTNDDGTGGMIVIVKVMMVLMDTKMMVVMTMAMDVWVLLKTALKINK